MSDHVRRPEPFERKVEARDRGLLGIALPPRILAQPPAHFEVAGKGRALAVDALQPAEAQEGAVGLALDDPEGVAVLALIFLDAAEGGLVPLPRTDAAEPAHDALRIGMTDELVEIMSLPGPEAKPLGLNRDFSH